MISIRYPLIIQHLQNLDYGLQPVYIPNENKFILIIKATKEVILTARFNNEIKIYLVEDNSTSASHVGLITAFFDDHDEPLVLKTPLFKGDDLLRDISLVLMQNWFELYFFDEHDREFMGVKALNIDFERFSSEIRKSSFSEFNRSEIWTVIKRLDDRFGMRDSNDDACAYTIRLKERLYPDDICFTDIRDQFFGFNDSERSIAMVSLEREGDPGPMQERDIAIMIGRVFDLDGIYINPYRNDTNKELTDILVITERNLLFIQAKDSPNTKEMLSRPIERKRKTIRSHIKKASNQLRGALTYARDNDGVVISNDTGDPIIIPLAERQLVGLVLVREMFDDDFPECSTPVLNVVRSLELPSILLDYTGLHIMTQNLTSPALFINGLFNMLDVALDNEAFPKPGWSGLPNEISD